MRYAINAIAWIIAISVVIFAIVRSGAFVDRRSEVVYVAAAANATKDSIGTDLTNAGSVGMETAQATPDGSDADDEDSLHEGSASPAAIALNDSAVVMMSRGSYGAAVQLLNKSLLEDSNYARAQYNLGVAFQKLNQLGNAIDAYKQAVSIRPHYYKPAYNLGLLHYSIAEYQEAVDWFLRAAEIRKSQASAPAHYNLGLAYMKLHKVDEADRSYREALRLQPGYIEARYNMALILMQRGDYAEAAEEFKKAAALGFSETKVYTNLGICYSRQGDDQNAVLSYARATQLDTTDASSWFNLAVAQGRLGHTSDAIKAYRESLKFDSSYYEASYNLGLLYSDLDQPDSAVSYYQLAIKINPSYSKAIYNLAVIFSRKQQYDSAANTYERVLELDPENERAMFNLGLAFGKSERYEKAVRAYHMLIDFNPVHEKGLNNLGTAYLKLSQYDSALVYFNRLVALTHSPESYFNRAKAHRELDSLDLAASDYRLAIESDPEYSKAYHNLALLEEDRNNLTEAVTLLKHAVSLEPAAWRSHWKLGQIYLAMNMPDKAREEYALAAGSNPASVKFQDEYNAILRQAGAR